MAKKQIDANENSTDTELSPVASVESLTNHVRVIYNSKLPNSQVVAALQRAKEKLIRG